MAVIPSRLPFPFSVRLSSTAAQLLNRQGREVDVAVGGIPFLLATNSELPRTVETIPLRKDQFDTEADPGEQSLSGWWRRSQDSFHEGAGNLYQESRTSNAPSFGFYDSVNVDVFSTRGEMRLCRKMLPVTTTNPVVDLGSFGTDYVANNMLGDGGFEQAGGAGLPSTTDNGAPNPVPTVSHSTTHLHTGAGSTNALKATWTAADGTVSGCFVLQFEDTMVDGATYRLRGYVWGATGNNDIGVSVEQGALGSGIMVSQTNAFANDWHVVDFTFTYTSGDEIRFFVDGVVGSSMDYWYDDFIAQLDSEVPVDWFDGNTSGAEWSDPANPYNSKATLTVTDTNGGLWYRDDNLTIKTMELDGTVIDTNSPSVPRITSSIIAGGFTYYGVSYGQMRKVSNDGNTGSQKIWNLDEGVGPDVLLWAKYRLWGLTARSIYTFASTPGSTSPLFTHPDTTFRFTCMTEGPAEVLVAGHNGHTSSIYSVTISDDGSVPTFSGAKVSAILPDGELVQKLIVLGGQYLGIGTSRGFRMGVIENSTITVGPLLFEPDGVVACTGIATEGRYILSSFQSDEGQVTYRVDTGTVVNELNPYCKDVQIGTTGYIAGLAVSGDRILAFTEAGDLYVQSDTELANSGYLTTGRIRFHTTEPKLFKYLDFETEPLAGQVVVTGLNEVSSSFDIGTLSAGSATRMALTSALGPQKQVAFTFTLSRDAGDTTTGPVINSYLLRAVPSVSPQRLHTLPLLCYDKEQARSGHRYGYDGYAAERLSALQAIEDVGDSITYQDFSRGTSGETVVIDSIRFVQTNANPGFGGILVLQLRTVTT